MTLPSPVAADIQAALDDVMSRHEATRDELIPILSDLNRKLGYLPSACLDEVAVRLQVPRSAVFSVATFYGMLNTRQLGRHVVLFCESAPCHVVGGRQVWNRLRQELDLESGETSEDGKWTLATVSCLGVCGVGPVIVIDDDIHGNVTPDMVAGILSHYA